MAMPAWAGKKVGPFPVWGWLGIGAAGIGLGFLMRRGFGGRDESPVPVTDDGEYGAGLSGASGFESDASFGDIQLGNIQEQLRQLGLPQDPGDGTVNDQATRDARRREIVHEIQDLTAKIEAAGAKRRRITDQINTLSASLPSASKEVKERRQRIIRGLHDDRRELEANISRLFALRRARREQRDRLAA